jgi:hypothetical protein
VQLQRILTLVTHKISPLMFEKVGLLTCNADVNRNNLRWDHMRMKSAIEYTEQLQALESVLDEEGPVGLLGRFFDEARVNQIISSLP